jgi:steroid delta-isomerase-like uncharacterized protein
MASDVERMIKDLYVDWNSHDPEKAVSFYTDDCVLENLATGEVCHGKNEVKAIVKRMSTDYPDFRFESKSCFASGNWAASEWVMTGTHTHSSVPAMPATGKRFSVRGVSILELRKGKISRETEYWNLADLMQQLGLMPKAPSK